MSAVPKFRILQKLTGDDPAARAALVKAAVDHAMQQPMASVVDRDSLVKLAQAAATEANTALLLSTHGRPAFERQKARSAANGEKVGDLLPPDTEQRVGRMLDDVRLPEAAWAKGLVDPKLVNKLVAPVLQQTLLTFAKRLPIPGMNPDATGAANALGGALLGGLGGLAGGAGKLFDVGKSVVGGLSAEVEKKMQAVAKDFAENASDNLRDQLRQRIESDEGKKLVREIVLGVVTKIRDVKVAEVLKDADVVPAADIDGLVAAVVGHNRARSAIAEVLRAEIDAAVLAEGSMTFGAWLDRAGIRAAVVEALEAKSDTVLRAFFSGPEFSAFLDLLLAD